MKTRFFSFAVCLVCAVGAFAQIAVERLNSTTVEIRHADDQRMILDFYGPNIVRIFQDPEGGIVRDPEATPPAQILVDQPRRKVGSLSLEKNASAFVVKTDKMAVTLDAANGLMSFTNLCTNRVVTAQTGEGVVFDAKGRTTLLLTAAADEAFYGGGVQNGRYAHAGQTIAIENTNNWVDGGVASPAPFYWSSAGYGLMWYTFRPGKYDFGQTDSKVVSLMQESPYLDVFLMINDGPVALLNDFYQLTGNPVLLPKFGFYEGHLNA